MTDISEITYSSRQLITRLWRDYLSRHKWWMAIAVVLMIIEGGTLAGLSLLLEPMFDRVFVDGDEDAIWWIGGSILGLFTIRGVSDIIKKTIMTRVAQKSSTEMQVDLFDHVLRLDSGFFHENSPGSLMERIQGDTVQVQGIWALLIQGIGRDFFALFWLFAVAMSIDVTWTLVAVVALPTLILPTAILQKYIRKKAHFNRAQAGHRSTRLDEVFHGINPVKLNQMEPYQMGRFRRIINAIVTAEIKIAASRATVPALVDIVTGLGFFAVLIVGGRDIIAGEKTVGEFMSFFTAMSLTFQPLKRLGSVAGAWQVAATSLERLYRLMDERPTILVPATPAAPPENTAIRFENVGLSYGDHKALSGADFTAKAGETTALVGASGAGKSTVFSALTRLADPQSGRVSIGGVSTKDMSLDDLRGLFSVVSQDTMLFDESIRENILLGRTDVSDDRLAELIKDAHISDFINGLPNGVDTPAGPRGSNLSGGQRQRVAIARALLRDAPILLLDEATSALDTKSEVAVQNALERLSSERTTLVIAHRLSTIRNADKIIVLDQGRVVDEGTHDALLERGGIYADLYAMQIRSEEGDD